MPDKKLTCIACNKDFVFKTSEQNDFARKGWGPPIRCTDCRMAKKAAAPSSGTYDVKVGAARLRTEFSAKFRPSGPPMRSKIMTDRIPADYLKNGYFDQHGLLRREIFAAEARTIAYVLNAHNTTSTRLRRFLNKLLAINYLLQQTGNFNNTKVQLAIFQTNVEYGKARKVVPQEFQDFIERNLPLAEQDPRSFAGFLEHYKSIVAFAKTEKNFSAADWLDGQGLTPDYLRGGYYDDNGDMRREAIIKWPMDMVKVFARASPPLSSTALRRFYNKVKGLDTKFKYDRDFHRLLPDLYALERDAAYAAARTVVPGVFISFTVKNIDLAIKDEKGFKGFVGHFQCIVAFAKG